MNEVSQGEAGNQEYVEFIVVDQGSVYDCNATTPPCVDLRGWIFDDNSGYHGGSGIAPGAVRFSFNALWSCVPVGTIVVIYNDADPNPQLPSDDISLSDGNCTIIAPIGNTSLFESNTTTPGAIACSYPATGWTVGGQWSKTLLANPSDCARIVDLGGCEVFSLCWNANNQNNLIYFPTGISSGGAANTVFYFNGIDPYNQANWSVGCADVNACGIEEQTPGSPNNAANAAYIGQFNNNCNPITPIVCAAVVNANAGCVCDGQASASALGSIPGYTYAWFDASYTPIGQTTATATGLCAGTYHVIATSSIGCSDTATVVITSAGGTTVAVNSQSICQGASTTLTATPSVGGGSFAWAPGGFTTQTITVSPVSTTVYTVTYDLAGCSSTGTGTVTVTNSSTPTFAAIVNVCQGAVAPVLPTTSTNGIAGTWSPAVSTASVGTTTYTFAPNAGQCAATTTLDITVNASVTPTFAAIANVCQGAVAPVLPTTSTNGITGTWSPAVSTASVGTTTYTFTPNAGQCASTATLDLTIDPSVTPTFAAIANVCQGAVVPVLPTTSTNGIVGTWSPAVSTAAAGTTTYTFTPNAGQCASTVTLDLTIDPSVTPTFAAIANVCQGAVSPVLPTTSTNGITGTWSPAVSTASVGTTTYTFTPNAGQCASTTTLDITVNASVTPTFAPIADVCQGAVAPILPTTSTNGIAGTWSPAVSTATVGTTTYTFTPSAGQCAAATTFDITVNALPVVNAGVDQTVCSGTPVTLNGLGPAPYSWDHGVTDGVAFVPAGTTVYTASITDGNGCSNTDQVTITVNPLPVVSAGPDQTVCEGTAINLSGAGAALYSWDHGVTNGAAFVPALGTLTYTVTGIDGNGCVNSDQVDVVVEATPEVSFTADLTSGCAPLEVVFTNTTPGNLSDCQWSFSNGLAASGCGSVTMVFPSSGLFDITLSTTSLNGCSNFVTYADYISVEENPVAAFTSSSTNLHSNTQAHFVNTSSGAVSYVWSFDGGNAVTTTNATYSFPNESQESYTVELIAYSVFGCSDTARATMGVNEELLFYVPNAFTPDGDEFNQTFKPVFTSGFDPYDFTMTIFNRWGELIFESHDASVGWDGTYGDRQSNAIQDATYSWKIEFKTTTSDERVQVLGHVTILR